MRASADERMTVSSTPPPWGPAGQPGWGPPPGSPGPPGQPGWGPPPAYPPLPKAGSARTGPLPLHPMTFSDILDGSFKLLKANLRTIVLVSALFLIPVNLVAAFLQRDLLGGYGLFQLANDPSLLDQAANTGMSNAALVGTLLAVAASILVTPFVGGAVSRIVAASYLGEELEPGEAIRVTGRRFLALLGAFFFTLLVKAVGLLFCLVGVLVPMTFFLVTTPAVMVEELGPIQAMARSVALVRPRFWQVMGIGIVSGLLASFLGNILATPFAFGALAIGYRWGWILVAVGGILPALVTTPFVAIVATLVYFDGRIRNEGFDLQVIAAELARGAPAR
jgi:MFS family permease